MDNICQDDSNNTDSFADLARVADPVQTWMQRANGPDDSESVSVRMSSVALRELQSRYAQKWMQTGSRR
eukprot:7711420-Pyramimonas_sp.AAC.1